MKSTIAVAVLSALALATAPAQAAEVRTMAIQFSLSSKLVLSVDANPVAGSPVRTSGYLGSFTQRWILPNNTTVASEYQLVPLIRSGSTFVRGCLDAAPGHLGGQLTVRPCNGSPSQKWKRIDHDNGDPTTALTLNPTSGLAVQEAFSFPGPVIQAQVTGAKNQRAGFIDIQLS